MGWQIGDTSRKYEVGSGGPTTVSSGKGDRGGVSYGTYQLSSKTGTCAAFVKRMGYTQYFGLNDPGSIKFSALWKKAPEYYPNFGADQHEFIRLTHYQSQIDLLKKNGIDLSKRGPAVQDSVWSTSVQFGGGTSLIIKVLSGKNVSKMSDADIVSAIQDYKIANNSALFKSSSDAVRASTSNRAKSEKADLIKLARSQPEPTEGDPLIGSIASIFDAISVRQILAELKRSLYSPLMNRDF